MKVLKEQLSDAVYEALKEINNGLITARNNQIFALMPEFVDVTVDMIYTANHISRVQTTAQDAATDTTLDAAAIDTEVNDPFVDTEVGGAGTETTTTGERVDTEVSNVGETTETRVQGERTTQTYMANQIQETAAAADWGRNRERMVYQDELGNSVGGARIITE